MEQKTRRKKVAITSREQRQRQILMHILMGVIVVVTMGILIAALKRTQLKKDVSDNTDSTKEETALHKEEDFFADACFIGDARLEMIGLFSGVESLDIFTSKGLTVDDALYELIARDAYGNKCSVETALKRKSYSKIYLSFGINELKWHYSEKFSQSYITMVEELKNIAPDAEIYVLGIMPVTAELSASDGIYNNVNIDTFNNILIDICDKHEGVTYMNVGESVSKDGVLPQDASVDGIHMNEKYSKQAMTYIMDHSN